MSSLWFNLHLQTLQSPFNGSWPQASCFELPHTLSQIKSARLGRGLEQLFCPPSLPGQNLWATHRPGAGAGAAVSSLGMTVLFQEVAVTRVPSICLTDFFQHATHTSQGSRARLMDVLVFLACTASMSQTSLTWNVASAAGGEGWRGGMKTTEDSSSQEDVTLVCSRVGRVPWVWPRLHPRGVEVPSSGTGGGRRK